MPKKPISIDDIDTKRIVLSSKESYDINTLLDMMIIMMILCQYT